MEFSKSFTIYPKDIHFTCAWNVLLSLAVMESCFIKLLDKEFVEKVREKSNFTFHDYSLNCLRVYILSYEYQEVFTFILYSGMHNKW